jgi:predicted alpha/beta superfamily hydrolase
MLHIYSSAWPQNNLLQKVTTMKQFFLLLMSALIAVIVAAQNSKESKVELPNTQVLKFKSAINNHDYVLYISLPDSYSDTRKKYPVLYVLDAQWSFTFPSVRGIQAGLYYDGFIPEMIIVGITWPNDYDENRGRDFTPTQVKGFPNSGSAPAFLGVIKNEIITLIDSGYRSDKNNNTLTGGSLGGLFELYTLFHEPALFNRYIIGSPALDYDDGLPSKFEKAYAQKNQTLDAKVFMHTGEYEQQLNGGYFNKFIDQLKARKYKGLQLETLVVEQMAHVSEVAYGVGRGLQFVFNKPDILVDTMLLDQYTGHYKSNEDSIIISRTGNSIYIINAFGKTKLYAETNDRFYAKGVNASGQFKKDSKGKMTDYLLRFENNTVLYKKSD